MHTTTRTTLRFGAPVTRELDTVELSVRGAIPSELRGHFVRNGPNPRPGANGHWFTGDGMVHGVWLGDGRALRYVNRWVRTEQFMNPRAARMRRDGTLDLKVGSANTSVIELAGKTFALVESSLPYELAPDLATVGPYDFDGRLTTPMTAHPKLCPRTGELHFFGYSVAPSLPALTYHRADVHGNLIESRAIDLRGRVMMHDFALSARHVIFMDLPVVFDQKRAMQGTMPFRWSDRYGARLGVMERHAGAVVRWFEIAPCYVFHVLNAFEDADTINLDAVRYPELWRESADDLGPATLHRWTLDLRLGTVREGPLDDVPIEFPRADETTSGSAQRYGYALGTGELEDSTGANASKIVKYDLTAKTSSNHDFGSGRSPGEPVFIASQAAAAEDDGWLVTFVYDLARDISDLVILDARTLTLCASVALPQRVPAGFHAAWIPA